MTSITDPPSFMGQARKRIQILDDFFFKNMLPSSSVLLDHIGYKCSSSEEYEAIKQFLMPRQGAPIASWLHESHISNRRIAFAHFKSEYELKTLCGPICYLELQDQKPDGSQVSGFDHVEFIFKGRQKTDGLIELLRMGGTIVTENQKAHHSTRDIAHCLGNETLIIKLSSELLVRKIKRDEMK